MKDYGRLYEFMAYYIIVLLVISFIVVGVYLRRKKTHAGRYEMPSTEELLKKKDIVEA